MNELNKVAIDEIPLNEEFGIFVLEKNVTNYSEGEKSENYIFKTLSESNDNSVFSEYLQNSIIDWSSEYHFSSSRANILRPINIKRDFDVLEIGGGCGAVTRYLGETGARVVSVEGAFNRAKCIKKRCDDLENVKVICSNIEAIKFENKFDVVTLIGVFEYTPKYSDRINPFDSALTEYKHLLKPGGALIIAIENKMGLKYFAGYNEDHYFDPYVGIEDRYVEKNVRTFGRQEIINLLKRNDYKDINFLYPFPDYKLPKIIFSENGLNADEFNISDLIRSCETRHYSPAPKANLINDNMVWKSIVQNNMTKDMSNSFLIVAKTDSCSINYITESLAQHYTCDRYSNLNTKIDFNKVVDHISVKKDILKSSKFKNNDLEIANHVIENKSSQYIYGSNLHNLIMDSILSKNKADFYSKIKKWIDYLKKNGIQELNKSNLGLSILNPTFYDCLPTNLIIDSNENCHLIDEEWTFKKKITLYPVLIRYLSRFRGYPLLYFNETLFFRKFINKILKQNGIPPINNRTWKDYSKLENEFLTQINHRNHTAPINFYRSVILLCMKLIRDFKDYIFNKSFYSH